jgi:hypothetical protein
MNGRLDKFGQWLSMGDRVKCPTQRQGTVREFAQSAGRQRVIVEYDGSDLGRVTLLPHLLEKVSAQKRCLLRYNGRQAHEEQGNALPKQPRCSKKLLPFGDGCGLAPRPRNADPD